MLVIRNIKMTKRDLLVLLKLVYWRFLWYGMLAFMALSANDPFIFSSQRKS